MFRSRGALALALVLAATVASPVSVAAAGRAVAIAAGGAHTCAVLADGTVRCWGANDSGQLGEGRTERSVSRPTLVVGVADATAIAAGGAHTCAIVARGGVVCWGSNVWGQLGTGTPGAFSSTPVRVADLSGVIALAAGDRHTCAILGGGTVRCWGSNAAGQLGNPAAPERTFAPVTVVGIGRAAAIGTGAAHTCVRLRDGGARCWGSNRYNQLGRETPGPVARSAILVTALRTMTSIVAGSYHTCGLAKDGNVRCWGWNAFGALGGGSSAEKSLRALRVPRLSSVVQLDAGEGLSCAVGSTGRVRCWGPNDFGGLGNGATADAVGTVVVAGVTDAVEVSVGRAFACSRLQDGGVRCWGRNSRGQLGDGSTEDRSSSVTVGL